VSPSERTIDALSDRFVDDVAALDPVMATYLGVAGHDHELPDWSPAGYDAREALVRDAVAAVEAATPVDERERVAQEAFLERNRLTLAMADAGYDRCEVSVISSAVHGLREAFDLMPSDGEQAADDLAGRLAAVPSALAGYRETLRAEAAKGRVSARRQYAEVAEQVRSWTGQSGLSGDYFAGVVDRLAADEETRDSLRPAAAAATAALADFGVFLEQELVPAGREREAVGREHYALASQYFLGTAIDLEETYAWGWQELKRISDDMAATADRVQPGASLSEAIAALDADPARTIHGREEFRAWMQDLADRTLADMDGTHFDIPEPVRRIECMLAPTNDGGIYYTGPSEDFSRPGRMWWSVPDGIDDFSPWREVTTVFHEGVPGHHLQVAQTAYRAELLNRWQRLVCWVSGHGEGWALYAERLMDDLGYLADPADRLGMLDAQSFRAARVIIDIGMHLELAIPADNPFAFHPGETWTPALGREFMGQHCSMEPAFLDFEVKRYLGWPGQAPSYKVGERIWLEAREDVRSRQGDAFDLKAFHRAALDLGSLGLDPFRAALSRL